MTDPSWLMVSGSLLLAGLAGSLHCVGMCGPLLLAFGGGLGGDAGGAKLDLLAYHAGRIWTYGLLGVVAGSLGATLRHGAAGLGWQRPLAVGLGVSVVVAGAVALGLGSRRPTRWTAACRWLSPAGGWLGSLARHPRRLARFLLGALLGLLPCGLVYAALLLVATFPTPLHAALGMVSFGVGTLPALSAVVLASRWMPPSFRAHGGRAVAVLLMAAGAFLVLRALLVTPGGHCVP